jgi:hypothetical protein
VSDILARRRTESRAFDEYEKNCKKEFQLSFWAGGVVRRIARTKTLDYMVRFGKIPFVTSATAKMLAHV